MDWIYLKESPEELKLSDYVENALHKVAVSEGFVKYKLQFEESSFVGDGYSGTLLKVSIVENDSSKQLKLLNHRLITQSVDKLLGQ